MDDILVYDSWLKVYKRKVGDKVYDILKNHDAVSVFIMNQDEEVLIVRQFRPSVMQETMEIPAGIMDIEGETPEQCAVREVLEETGIAIDEKYLKRLTVYKPMMGFSSSTMYVLIARVKQTVTPEKSLLEKDVTSAEWISMDTLKDYINRGLIYDSKTLMAYYCYRNLKD